MELPDKKLASCKSHCSFDAKLRLRMTKNKQGSVLLRRLLFGVVFLSFAVPGARAQARYHRFDRPPMAHRHRRGQRSRRRLLQHTPPRVTDLSAAITELLQAPSIARAHWGIEVTTLTGAPVYSLHANQFFHPASNAKLLTTAATLDLMDPNARWRTQVVTTGTIDASGTLHGNLVILGSGDPTLSGRSYPFDGRTERTNDTTQAFASMADQIAKDGIRHIDGNIIGNDTWFTWEPYGQGWAQDDLMWDYGAPISALTINDNVVYLNIEPEAYAHWLNTPGVRLIPYRTPTGVEEVTWNPPVPYYHLINTSRVTRSRRASAGLNRAPGSMDLSLFGTINANGVHVGLAIKDPAQFTAMTFAHLLRERGITITGTALAQHQMPSNTGNFEQEREQPVDLHPILNPVLGPSADGRRVLAFYTSRATLAQDVKVTLKVSQNLHAELYLRDLGRYELGQGSFIDGARVVRQFMQQAGVSSKEYLFFDGSGMSYQDIITPHALATLLAYAAHQPWGALYRNALPVGGVDGTLQDRFTAPWIRGRVDAKTGTLSEVNTLSGYVTDRSGQTLVFSILCNSHRPGTYAERETIDRIVEAVAAHE